MLGFHSQNVPIIIEEDDMKFAEIKLENNKTTGKNWALIGFVTPEDVLSRIVMDLIYGSIDGIKLVMDLGPDSFKRSKYFRRNSHRRVSLLPFRL